MSGIQWPTAMSDLLKQLIKDWGIERQIDQGMIIDRWDQIAGAVISQKTKIVKIEKGKIFLKVETPAWRQELFFQKTDLIQKTNRYLGKDIIKEILFI